MVLMPLQREVETLSNGLTLVVETQPWNPGVAMQILVPVGAITDPEGMEGAANLLEGWLWKGAGERDGRTLAETLDDLGVRRGSGAGLEYTTFGAQFLANQLDAVLAIYADVLLHPQLETQSLEAVKQIALQELASIEDQPSRKLFTALRRNVFTSPQGRNPGGVAAHLEALDAQELKSDFCRRYTPKGAILAVVGGVSMAQVQQALVSTLGQWNGESVDHPVYTLSAPHRIDLVQDTAQVHMGLIYPDVTFGHPGFYTARVATQILSGSSGSRLFTEVREKRGLVYAVGASPAGVRGYTYLSAHAGTTPERAEETLEVMKAEIERLSEGVTSEELKRAKVGLRTLLVMQEESARSRVSTLIRDLYTLSRIRSLDEIEGEIAAIDLSLINQYLADYPYRNPWVGTLGPRGLA
jgi:predicted Zn-dependent peptidase